MSTTTFVRRKPLKKALKKIDKRTEELMAQGMSKKAARAKTYDEARHDNPQKHMRIYKKKR